MKSEMDLLGLDERQRQAWLLANRVTLIAVGMVWVGMVIWEALRGGRPLFLLAMIPVFALVRLGVYRYYVRTGA